MVKETNIDLIIKELKSNNNTWKNHYLGEPVYVDYLGILNPKSNEKYILKSKIEAVFPEGL